MFICLLIFFFFFFWVLAPRVKDERFKPMLLISFRSGRNGQNILYRHAIRYGNTTRFTSGPILASFMKFRPFHHVPANFDWNVHFNWYQILNLKKKKKRKKKNYKPINLRPLPCSWLPFFFLSSPCLLLLLLLLF